MYFFLLFLLSVILIRISVSHSEFRPAFKLFLVACSIKLIFLFFWINYKTGGLDLDYLQFVDEFYYLKVYCIWFGPSIHTIGELWTELYGNAYSILIYFLRNIISFSLFDIKVLNIFAASFALVRLYSLIDLVENKKSYYRHLLILGAILHIHVHYYAVFILKDALIFFFSMELFVHLVRRPISQRNWPIFLCILILSLLRSALIFLFFIFVFDNHWNISKKRLIALLIVAVIFSGTLMNYGEDIFSTRARIATQYGIENHEGRRVSMDEAKGLIISDPSMTLLFLKNNLKELFLPFVKKDITDRIIIVTYYIMFFYLLKLINIKSFIRTMWPILLFPFTFLTINLFFKINIRWAIYPFSYLLFAMVFFSCNPLLKNFYNCKENTNNRSLHVLS